MNRESASSPLGPQGLSTALSFLGCTLAAGWIAAHAADRGLMSMFVVALACACGALLAATRWVREGPSHADALLPVLVVLLPAWLQPGRAGLAAWLGAAVLVALAACGKAAFVRRFAGPDAPGRRVLSQETLGLVLMGLMLWLRHFDLPQAIVSDELDTSWSAAFGQFLVDGKRAGSDWIFTAGPLAGLNSSVFTPELLWAKLVLWEGVWRLCTVVCLVLAMQRIPGLLERCLCFLVLLVPPLYFDPYAFATLAAAAVLLDDREDRRNRPVEFLALAAIGGLALTKFTLLVASAGVLGALALSRGSRRGRGAGLRFAAAALGVLGAIWFLSGQGLANLFPYLRGSFEIASNYSEAQSTFPAEWIWRVHGEGCVALLGAALALWVLAGGRSLSKASFALGMGFLVFCAWKTGFVRAGDHVGFFFDFAAPAALLLPRPRAQGWLAAAGLASLRLATLVLAFTGHVESDFQLRGIAGVYDDVKQGALQGHQVCISLSDPFGLRDDLIARLKVQRESLALTKVAERVGRETIDLLGHRQGQLILQQLNWTPRPAFQGYITFTPWLQQRNADFLAGDSAPRYLLSRLETIDERWLTMDDALALEVASRRYRPVLMERDYLLLERRAEPRPELPRELALERELRFGELLELPPAAPDCAQLVTFEFEYTLLGKLKRLADSTPPMRMRARRQDGVLISGRIVPATMRSRVLIDPLVCMPSDWVKWMLGRPLPRCTGFVVAPPVGAEWMLGESFHVRVESARELQPPPEPEFELHDWMDGVFSPRPDIETTPLYPTRMQVGSHEVALVHAPSRFLWNLAPGRYRLSGLYGMAPETWQRDNVDGADFRVELFDGKAPRVLLRREFRPDQPAAERAPQKLELEFELAEQGRLMLATGIGAGSNDACDWCFWSEVKIERVKQP